jgi:hypothetical protein
MYTPNGIFFELLLMGPWYIFKENTAVQYESEDE